jgi:hypothetical protein
MAKAGSFPRSQEKSQLHQKRDKTLDKVSSI